MTAKLFGDIILGIFGGFTVILFIPYIAYGNILCVLNKHKDGLYQRNPMYSQMVSKILFFIAMIMLTIGPFSMKLIIYPDYVVAALLTFAVLGALSLLVMKAWLFFFNVKYHQAILNTKWREHINDDQSNNWFIRNHHRYTNLKCLNITFRLIAGAFTLGFAYFAHFVGGISNLLWNLTFFVVLFMFWLILMYFMAKIYPVFDYFNLKKELFYQSTCGFAAMFVYGTVFTICRCIRGFVILGYWEVWCYYVTIYLWLMGLCYFEFIYPLYICGITNKYGIRIYSKLTNELLHMNSHKDMNITEDNNNSPKSKEQDQTMDLYQCIQTKHALTLFMQHLGTKIYIYEYNSILFYKNIYYSIGICHRKYEFLFGNNTMQILFL